MWQLDSGGHRASQLHPINDIRPHVVDGNECWCGAESNEDGTIVHNAADGREQYERGERKPQ